MLDAAHPLPVPDPDVLAFPDLDDPAVGWALPAAARLAVAPDGGPDVALLLYRRGRAGPTEGGQLTLAVDFALTEAERATVAAAVAARRPPPDPPPTRGESAPPPVEVRPPQWVEGTVRVTLLPGVTVEGRTSLLADNHCTLALSLTAAQAGAVERAWADGFPDAVVEADLEIEAAVGTTATAGAEQTRQAPGRGAYESVELTATSRAAVRLPLHLSGPLRLPVTARTTRRTDVPL